MVSIRGSSDRFSANLGTAGCQLVGRRAVTLLGNPAPKCVIDVDRPNPLSHGKDKYRYHSEVQGSFENEFAHKIRAFNLKQ